MGDPDFYKVPISQLLDSQYLDTRWRTFNPAAARLPEAPGALLTLKEPTLTTHFSVMDRYGNAVAITTTVNAMYGSRFVPAGTGVMMNDEMDDFSLEPGIPNRYGLIGKEANSIQPKKRPLSSMTPTIVRDASGRNRLVVGAQGGPRIITAVFHTLLNRIQFGMALSDAVNSPRFHHQWRPKTLLLERFGFSPATQQELTRMGYELKAQPALARLAAIERFENGDIVGVPDRRTEGEASAE
jgi:gamma-glutamyltranspeptidase/glutathione hydrolase